MERSLPIQRMQRLAFDTLKQGVGKIDAVPDGKITMPASIQQELAYVNTNSRYRFRFGSDAPDASTALSNKKLGDNDVIAVYGVQVLYGYNSGVDKTNREYRAYGVTPSDNALYNGELQMNFESTTPVAFMELLSFKDERVWNGNNGLNLINPIRIITGDMSKFDVVLDLDDISGLTLTANAYIMVKLHGALGRA